MSRFAHAWDMREPARCEYCGISEYAYTDDDICRARTNLGGDAHD